MNEHGNNDGNRPISGRRRARCRLQGIALSVLCLFFAACAQTFPDGDVLERYPDGGVPIRLTVSLPQSAFPEKRTKVEKASDETENRIEEMRILVFERNESGYAYRYMVEAEQLQSSGTGVLFQAKLLSTPNPVKLMLVGNYGDAFAVYAPSPGDSEADVKAGTGCSFGESLRSLPMYGQIVIPSGLEADRENRYSVKMLRAAARVDVEKDLAADSRPLRIESIRIYRANDKIQIAPDEAVDEESLRVAAPSVFAGAVKSADRGDLHRRGRVLRRRVLPYLLPDRFQSWPRRTSVRSDIEELPVRFPNQEGDRPRLERSCAGGRESCDGHRR